MDKTLIERLEGLYRTISKGVVYHDKECVLEAISALQGSKWISVSDRLPEDTPDFVLICNDIGFVTAACGDWVRREIETGRNYDGLTHWMPLPAPPVNTGEER